MEDVPAELTKGVFHVAAERVRVAPRGSLRSSCKKERKLVESLGLIILHPTPCWLGNSQLKREVRRNQRNLTERDAYSKSIPSNLYFWAMSVTDLTNAVRFPADPTFGENHLEPVHPPIDKLAFTP